MSVKGCYTDFHIDFGGTSVWYHILKGEKVFWLIPPTEQNLELYTNWTLSGKQSKIFFGDTVDQCYRVFLYAGNTFFIPSGWIHAVYTAEDSIVFGGNFLHSFGISKQLTVAEIEYKTKVPVKYRFPFFNQLLWYVINQYVHCLMGTNHLSVNDDGLPYEKQATNLSQNVPMIKENIETENCSTTQKIVKNESETLEVGKHSVTDSQSEKTISDDDDETDCDDEETEDDEPSKLEFDEENKPTSVQNYTLNAHDIPQVPHKSFHPTFKVHLTKQEVRDLPLLYECFTKSPHFKRSVPKLLASPNSLLEDFETLISEHKDDQPDLAVTNKPALFKVTKKVLNHFKSEHHVEIRTVKEESNVKLKTVNKVTPLSSTKTGSLLENNVFARSLNKTSSTSSAGYTIKSGSTITNDLLPDSFRTLIAESNCPINSIPSIKRKLTCDNPTGTTKKVANSESVINFNSHDKNLSYVNFLPVVGSSLPASAQSTSASTHSFTYSAVEKDHSYSHFDQNNGFNSNSNLLPARNMQPLPRSTFTPTLVAPNHVVQMPVNQAVNQSYFSLPSIHSGQSYQVSHFANVHPQQNFVQSWNTLAPLQLQQMPSHPKIEIIQDNRLQHDRIISAKRSSDGTPVPTFYSLCNYPEIRHQPVRVDQYYGFTPHSPQASAPQVAPSLVTQPLTKLVRAANLPPMVNSFPRCFATHPIVHTQTQQNLTNNLTKPVRILQSYYQTNTHFRVNQSAFVAQPQQPIGPTSKPKSWLDTCFLS